MRVAEGVHSNEVPVKPEAIVATGIALSGFESSNNTMVTSPVASFQVTSKTSPTVMPAKVGSVSSRA